ANTHILRPEGAAGCSHGCSEAATAAERNPWITSVLSSPAPKGQRNTAHRLTARSSAHGTHSQRSRPSPPPHASMPPCLDAFFSVVLNPRHPDHTSGAHHTLPHSAHRPFRYSTLHSAPSSHPRGMEVPEEGVLPFLRHQRTQPPSRLSTPGPPHPHLHSHPAPSTHPQPRHPQTEPRPSGSGRSGPVHRHPNPPERRRHAPTPTSSAPKGRRAVATGAARPPPRPSGTRGSHPLVQPCPEGAEERAAANARRRAPRAARIPRPTAPSPLHPRLMPRCPLPRCLLLCRPQSSPHIRRDRATRYRACPRPSTTTPRYTPARAVTSPPGDGGAGGRGPPLPPASAHPTSVTPRNSRPTAPTPAQPPGAVHPPPAAASPKPNRDR